MSPDLFSRVFIAAFRVRVGNQDPRAGGNEPTDCQVPEEDPPPYTEKANGHHDGHRGDSDNSDDSDDSDDSDGSDNSDSEDHEHDDDDDESIEDYCAHEGCCSRHWSLRRPNPHPCVKQTMTTPSHAGNSPPADAAILPSHTLAPIHHAAGPYHLSFENLACMLPKLDPHKASYVPDISQHGESTVTEHVSYRWSGDVYYYRGSFLQFCGISFILYRGRNNYKTYKEHLFGCPHQKVTISKPRFWHKNGVLVAEALVTNTPPLPAGTTNAVTTGPPSSAPHKTLRWTSSQGRYTQAVACPICRCDAELILCTQCDGIGVDYHSFRDLGPATDLYHPNWVSLLTGEGTRHRPPYKLDVLHHVWYTAFMKAGRYGMEEYKHRTPYGVFMPGQMAAPWDM